MFIFDWSVFWALLAALMSMEGINFTFGRIVIWQYKRKFEALQTKLENGDPEALDELSAMMGGGFPMPEEMPPMPTASGKEDHYPGNYL